MADVVVDRAAYQWAEAERARLETENKQLRDLGRELYDALDDAIAHNVNATNSDSAGWTQEDYDTWDAARARYEREVGT